MPTRSELQRQAHDIPNPFEDDVPRIKEYTAKEIAILQSRLDKQLGPEYISTRKGPGGQNVHYLAADKIINLANEVFGFNGWSTSIRDTTIDYVDIEKDGKVAMGLSVIMRVTLKDGTYHEDIGYGTISNCSGKGAAFEKTKKEATTDAMKRALRNFGNVLGNCIYDKEYLKKVVKVKAPPGKWNVEDLHRHPDVAPPKPANVESSTEKTLSLPPTRAMSAQSRASASTDHDDEFGGNAFDDVDFTRSDEFTVQDASVLEDSLVEVQQRTYKPENIPNRQPPQRPQPPPQSRPQPQPQPQQNAAQRPTNQPMQVKPPQQQAVAPATVSRPNPTIQGGRMAPPQQISDRSGPPRPHALNVAQPHPNPAPPNQAQQRPTNLTPEDFLPPGLKEPETPVGFVTGRAAEAIQGLSGQRPPNTAFNPYAESPSIRKTSGIDHRTSGPVKRDQTGAPQPAPPPKQAAALNVLPPQPNNGMNGGVGPNAVPNTVSAPSRSNYVNPMQDSHRRIGAPIPAGMQSPGLRSGGYKPPGPAGVKRGPPDAISRAPLGDLSNVNKPPIGDIGNGGPDEKRMRIQGQEESAGPLAAA